jgi:outer membrane assembly lipoprotein YfiO
MMKQLLLITIILILGCAYFEPQFVEKTASGMDQGQAVSIYDKGNEYFKAKDYSKAVIEFEKIIKEYRFSDAYEPALYLTAFCYYKLNDFEESATLGERFIKEFPNSSYYLNAASLLGESYYKVAKDYEAAYYLIKFYTQSTDSSGREAAFERIIKILPELSIKELEKLHRIFMAEAIDEHILFNLAQIEAREGKKKEAERDLNILVRRFPNTKYVYEVEEYKRFIGLGETTGRAGILLPLTGNFSSYGQKLLEIIKVFKRDMNLPFSIHTLDTKSDPIEAINAATKLIEDLHVDFIIAPIRVYEAFGVCGVAHGKGIPVILPLTSESRFESIPLVFTSSQSGEAQAEVIAEYSMYELGIMKFAILYADMMKYQSIAQVFADEVVDNLHQVVAMVGFQPDSITLKWQIEGIKEKKPGAIFLAMDTDMIINTAPQIAYYGLEDIKILGIDTFKDEKIPRLGERYVDGVVFAAPTSVDSLTLREFKKAGYEGDELTAKFFRVLWQLRDLKNYDRSTLSTLISKILKGREVFDIYEIKGYEFIKLAEISKEKE